MIDGVFISAIPYIEQSRRSHYKNLQNTFNKKNSMKFWLQPKLKKVYDNKRHNHVNWKSFHKSRQQQFQIKRNNGIFNRLSRISQSRSQYAVKKQGSFIKDPLLHHNYKYECMRRYKDMQKKNQKISSRILKVSSKLCHKKDAKEYEITRQASSRLSKFQLHKRMNKIISHSIHKSQKIRSSFLDNNKNAQQRCKTEYHNSIDRDI